MAAIRGLVFDKDGTLFDFNATWSSWSRRLLRELSEGSEGRARDLGAAIGFDMVSGRFAPDSPVIAHTAPEIAAHLLPYLPGHTPEELVALMNLRAAETALVPAVPLQPLFQGLAARGLRIGLVTNDAEAAAAAHLASAGLTGSFDFVAGFDSGHGNKPDAAPLLAFAAAVGLLPSEIVMVGDSRHDLVAGRVAGMRTVGVLTGIAGANDLAPHADAVLADIGRLPEWLDRIAATGA